MQRGVFGVHIAQGRHLYGDGFLVYSVHSLVHLASDANLFGSLDECSAFSFENYLHQMGRLVHSELNSPTDCETAW